MARRLFVLFIIRLRGLIAEASPLPRPATHGSILGVAGRGSGLVV